MRPALPMAAALAAGIVAADWLRPHPAVLFASFVALAVAVWRARGGKQSVRLLLVALALFGALHHAYQQTAGRGSLAAWEGQKVSLTGTVVSEPEVQRGRGVAYILRVEAAQPAEGEAAGAVAVDGRLYVTQRSGTSPGYGERVEVEGRLATPSGPRMPGGFDQAAYLARQSVYLTLNSNSAQPLGPGRLDPIRRVAVSLRLKFEDVLRKALPQKEAALMAGLLFGSRSDLPEEIKESFRATGVFHLLAVSGGNVAMLTLPLLWVLRRIGLGKRAASGLAVPVVVFFVLLTGASPSVLRAGLMAALVLLGDLAGRERNALNTLGVAVGLLLAWSPSLLFDLGFQLSVGATLGIMLLARPIEGWFAPRFEALLGERLGRWLAAGLSVTFAAQAVVEPLTLHHFGTFSTIAPVANLVVVLFVGWLVPAGLVAVGAGALWSPAIWPLAVFGGVILRALVYAVKAMATLPFAYLELGSLPMIWAVAWYALLFVMLYPAARRQIATLAGWLRAVWQGGWRDGWPGGWRVRWSGDQQGGWQVGWPRTWAQWLGVLLLLLSLGAATFAWRQALAGPPDEVRVTFLDVGQGDATLIEAPGGRAVLVDAGPAFPPREGRPGFDAGEQVVVPFLRQRGVGRLDYLILTHPDTDHAGGGAAVLRVVPTSALLLTSPDAPEPGQAGASTLARERGTAVHFPVEGERLDLGGGLLLEVLGPPVQPFVGTRSDDNANCIALRLVYRQVALLLTCDLEAVAEERLVAVGYDLRADLLKVSHHGSGYSSTESFLAVVSPSHAVISVGSGNSYGHPHSGALARLREAGAEIWRTDRHGSITLRTDGFRLRLGGSRGDPADDAYRPLGLLGRRLFGAW